MSTEPILFDEQQNKLTSLYTGKHFVNAPPGAGKTAILTARLADACARYTEDNEIVCLTFTTRAATEMQLRAASVLGERQPFIGNFHAFCMEVIRNSRLPYHTRAASILPDEYKHQMLNMAKEHIELNTPAAKFPEVLNTYLQHSELHTELQLQQSAYSPPSLKHALYQLYIPFKLIELGLADDFSELIAGYCKSHLMSSIVTVQMQSGLGSIEPETALTYLWLWFKAFVKVKKQSRCLDFDDVLCIGLQELLRQPQPRAFIQIDEVQDLNPIQWAILSCLQTPTTHIFAVGDSEQSIYRFLGADLALLHSEVAEFTPHSLAQNYRSHPAILSILNQYRHEHWQLPPIISQSDIEEAHPTLLLQFNDAVQERERLCKAVAQIIAEPDRNVGLLVPTNALCNVYAETLLNNDISFFQVSQSDLLQKAILQDWFSWLKVLDGSAARMDWWSILFRLSRHTGGNKMQLADVIALTNKIQNIGLPIEQVLYQTGAKENLSASGTQSALSLNNDESNTHTAANTPELLNYPLKQLCREFADEGVVIFDTETTGLDFFQEKIIQLAAVRVINGKVVAEFDRYVDVGLAADPRLYEAFIKSQAIHHITEEQVKNGDPLSVVLQDFFVFVGTSPLIAHNMHFDKMMLRTNIQTLPQDNELLADYHRVAQQYHFDTLVLSRMMYPEEKSHRLESLLECFGLEGVNSHNALDDVKATASLLTKIVADLPERMQQVDAVLDEYSALINPVNHHLKSLFPLFYTSALKQFSVGLVDVLRSWLEYTLAQSTWYDAKTAQVTRLEIERKLIPWLDRQGYFGDFPTLVNSQLWQNKSDPAVIQQLRKIDTLFMLKEIDLIDPEQDKVVISTVHRAKGLEFDTVLLPSTTENAYPGWIPKDTPNVEVQARRAESKRLLYVALSRPKRKLIISYHCWDGRYSKQLSPFLQGSQSLFSYTQNAK